MVHGEKRTRPAQRLGTILIAAALAGCGGGGGSAGPAPVAPSAAPAAPGSTPAGGTAQATLRFVIGAPSTIPAGRRVRFTAPTIQGVAVVATGTDGVARAQQTFDVSAGSALCGPAAAGRTCTIPVQVPIGNGSLAISTYDAPPVAGGAFGRKLSSATVQTTINAGSTANTISVTLNGVVAKIAISYGNNVQLGATGNVTLNVAAFDADGNQIVGDAFANPITIASADTTGAVTVSPSTLPAPGSVTLSYNGAIPPVAGFALTASADGVPASAISGTVWRPDAPRANIGTFNQYVLPQTVVVTVASPLPTVAPGFGSPPSPLPTPTTIAVANQYSEARFVPAQTSATLLGVALTARSEDHGVLANTAPFQIANTDDFYTNLLADGNRIDGVNVAEIQTDTRKYTAGTYNRQQTFVWPKGQIVYKSPLTAGDAWTNDASKIQNLQISDTRPSQYQQTYNDTITYASDGSFVRHVVASYSDGTNGTYDVTVKPDGSLREVDQYGGGGPVETDTITNNGDGTYTETFSITGGPLGSRVVSGSATAPNFGFSPQLSESWTTVGYSAIDPKCSVSSYAFAYLTTRTLKSSYPGQSTTVRNDQYYVVPGVGVVCQQTTTTTNFYYLVSLLNLGTPANPYYWSELSPTAQPAQTRVTTQVRTLSSSGTLPQSVVRRPQTLAAPDPGGGGFLPDPDTGVLAPTFHRQVTR